MSKTYAQIAKAATDAEATANQGRSLFETSFKEWSVLTAADKRDNKVISAEQASVIGEWKISTSPETVALHKVAGAFLAGEGTAVVDGKTVVARPGGRSAVGIDDDEWSLWTAIQSARRSGGGMLTEGIPLAAMKSAALSGKTLQERVNALLVLVNDRAAAESAAVLDKEVRENAAASVEEENAKTPKKKRVTTRLSLLKAIEGAATRFADGKGKDGTVLLDGGSQAEIDAMVAKIVGLLSPVVEDDEDDEIGE